METYEEKYNEILEWARKNKARLNGVPIEEVLPELAESEDERIRKEIYNFFKNFKETGTWKSISDVNTWLAYLGKQKDLTTENIYKHSRERMSFWNGKQKEQKPEESISQLTVQGKGVYKICPRCKERMVRDDSMVYTSMPPQYRYECPKCGESECDTVMYDNPEMEEQKPNSTEDMPYITYEHFYKREPAEWSEEDEKIIGRLRSVVNECASYNDALDVNGDYCEGDYAKLDSWLKSLSSNLKKKNEDVAKLCSNEWSKEDERMLKWIEDILLIADDDLSDKLNGRVSPITDSAYSSMKLCIAKCHSWLKSLRPSWKPTEEQMEALLNTLHPDDPYYPDLKSLYEQLKKL